MFPATHGAWVKHEDAQAAVAQARGALAVIPLASADDMQVSLLRRALAEPRSRSNGVDIDAVHRRAA